MQGIVVREAGDEDPRVGDAPGHVLVPLGHVPVVPGRGDAMAGGSVGVVTQHKRMGGRESGGCVGGRAFPPLVSLFFL